MGGGKHMKLIALEVYALRESYREQRTDAAQAPILV